VIWSVELRHRVERELEGLPDRVRQRIVECIRSLRDNPRPTGVSSLQGGSYSPRDQSCRDKFIHGGAHLDVNCVVRGGASE